MNTPNKKRKASTLGTPSKLLRHQIESPLSKSLSAMAIGNVANTENASSSLRKSLNEGGNLSTTTFKVQSFDIANSCQTKVSDVNECPAAVNNSDGLSVRTHSGVSYNDTDRPVSSAAPTVKLKLGSSRMNSITTQQKSKPSKKLGSNFRKQRLNTKSQISSGPTPSGRRQAILLEYFNAAVAESQTIGLAQDQNIDGLPTFDDSTRD